MLVRRLTALTPMAPRHFFGVDAKTLTIGVPKEVHQNETRVGLTP